MLSIVTFSFVFAIVSVSIPMLLINTLIYGWRSVAGRAFRALLFRLCALHTPRCVVYEHTGAELIQALKLSQSKHQASPLA